MSAPTIPPPFDSIADSTFSFFPPILNIEHNQWRFRKATWSEVLVANTGADLEVWVPRRVIGEVSSVDDPVVIVGLLKELEYKAGSLWPHERKVVSMPLPSANAVESSEQTQTPGARLAIEGSGRSSPTESRMSRMILLSLGFGLALFLAIALVVEIAPTRTVKFTSKDQDYLALSRNDDYFAVVRRLGKPAEDRWRSATGELQYRALWYPERSYSVILLGTDRNSAHYIGALDKNWRVIHYVELPGGADTSSMLRGMGKF